MKFNRAFITHVKFNFADLKGELSFSQDLTPSIFVIGSNDDSITKTILLDAINYCLNESFGYRDNMYSYGRLSDYSNKQPRISTLMEIFLKKGYTEYHITLRKGNNGESLMVDISIDGCYVSNSNWRFCSHINLWDKMHHRVQNGRSLGEFAMDQLAHAMCLNDRDIYLVDEPCLGMHPDTQAELVRYFIEAQPTSQFIVATNSYEFCAALTPSHVQILT